MSKMNIVDGYKHLLGEHYMQGITPERFASFASFFDSQVRPDPYSQVRDRGMIKIKYSNHDKRLWKNENQNYFQSYDVNDSDGGKVRQFPEISDELLKNEVFLEIFRKNYPYLEKYCAMADVETINISVHFIRYKVEKGGASYGSPVWLHVDNEPLVFIHLINLTPNAIGGDNIISEMDSKPTNVLRLQNALDTLIVDPTKKHAVTPLGSHDGMAHRDVLLINVETDLQQQ